MIEQDTIRLLRECDAGIKMGVASISDVLDDVSDQQFQYCLNESKSEHEKLEKEVEQLLERYHDEGKEISPMAKAMSWMKTNVKLAMNGSDKMIADVMVDGCNMGVKSLHKYLNQYEAADEESKDITKRLISLEKDLVNEMFRYL